MTTSSLENTTPWNGVERRLNGTSPDRVAILCGAIRRPRAPSGAPMRRPAPDYRDEAPAPARSAAC